MREKTKILWYGPPFSYSGYGLHNRKIVLELDRRGFDVALIPTEKNIPEKLKEKERLVELARKNKRPEGKTIAINCVPPPSTPCRADYSILYTTLESKDVHWGAKLRASYFDELWLPCRQNMKAFRRAGFRRKKLFYAPEGVDVELHSREIGKSEKYSSQKYTFFYLGDWSLRKGIPYLLKAFSEEFICTENVRLLLLVHYQGHDEEKSRERILEEFEYFKKKLKITYFPQIDFIFSYPSDVEISQIYNSVDCYVSPSLGEAWNLPVIQAMSHELPIITTNYGGMQDFCTHKNSYLIDVEKFDIMDNKTNLHVDFYKGQKFAFPSVEHLKKILRHVFYNQENAKKKGWRARMDCVEKWTWKRAGERIAKRLKKLERKL